MVFTPAVYELPTEGWIMETATMGKVVVTAKIINLQDLFEAQKGLIAAEAVRSVEVTDALVDTGSTYLMAPKRLIAQLGLQSSRTRQSNTCGGLVAIPIYRAVQLVIQGREYIGDVGEVPDNCPVLIGQMPLEGLDFVVDPNSQRLIGNPAHGGEHMIDLY
jgi:predicted aspartyl protease